MAGSAQLIVRVRVANPAHEQPRLDLNLEFSPGITAVTGPSGAGKTTLLNAIAGLLKPEQGYIELAGKVFFDSKASTFTPAHKRRVALVFQSLALFPHLCAWKNVAYGIASTNKDQRQEQARAWLARARVGHLADRMPASLSGGEAQRVAIARALASTPQALLLDEPFSALDVSLRQELGLELKALVAGLGIPALLVTHHQDDASGLGSRIIELENGRAR